MALRSMAECNHLNAVTQKLLFVPVGDYFSCSITDELRKGNVFLFPAVKVGKSHGQCEEK